MEVQATVTNKEYHEILADPDGRKEVTGNVLINDTFLKNLLKELKETHDSSSIMYMRFYRGSLNQLVMRYLFDQNTYGQIYIDNDLWIWKH